MYIGSVQSRVSLKGMLNSEVRCLAIWRSMLRSPFRAEDIGENGVHGLHSVRQLVPRHIVIVLQVK